MFWQWIFGAFFLVWIIFSAPKLIYLQDLFNIIGIFLLFVGILGRLYATLYIGGMKNSGSDGNSFISDGIYSVCRNPLYFFSFVGLLGILFLKGQLILVILGAVLFLLIYRFTILGEEKFLSDKFGDSYKEFLKNTPRFFPDFSRFKYSERLEIRPFFLHKEVKRAFVWLFVALFIYVISILQNLGFLPILITIY